MTSSRSLHHLMEKKKEAEELEPIEEENIQSKPKKKMTIGGTLALTEVLEPEPKGWNCLDRICQLMSLNIAKWPDLLRYYGQTT